MAELKVTFKLSDRDIRHLRRSMRKASSMAKGHSEESILKAALTMAQEVRKFKPPEYVTERLGKLESLAQMVEDKAYGLPSSMRQKVLGALCYFTTPTDLIPDTVPGLGFLDDAIMIELVARELKHELAAYQDFCSFRERAVQRPWTRPGGVDLERKLSQRRRKLRDRVEERMARDAERARLAPGLSRIW